MVMRSFGLTLVILFVMQLAGEAAEPKVLFADSFEKGLGEGWSWLRENPQAWRLRDGALEIRVEPGKADRVKNALVRKAPDRSQTRFAVEVSVTFTAKPTHQYEQAGITWYHDERPVMKLVHEHIDGKEWIIPGRKPAPSRTVHLRLVVDGRRWTSQFREKLDEEYVTTATGELPPPGNDQLSIQCYEGPDDAAHWIRFDRFRITELAASDR